SFSRWPSLHTRLLVACFTLPHEPAVAREHNRLGPGIDVELAEDAGQVIAHRLLADEDALCNLGIAETAGHEAQDVELPGSQPGKRRDRRRIVRPAGIAAHEFAKCLAELR